MSHNYIKLLLIILIINFGARGFNLDVENIRTLSPELNQKGSFFGYSLAFYRDDQNRYIFYYY